MALRSVLGRRDVVALAFGAIVGWGWVVLSGTMIDQAGSLGSMVAVLIAAVMVACVGLTYAELTTAIPRAGGALAFTYRALGREWSWVCGWSLALAYVSVCAFEAVAMGTVLTYLFPAMRGGTLYYVAGSGVHASWIAVGVVGGLLIGFLNWRGVKTSAIVQSVGTGGLLLVGLTFFVGSGLWGHVDNLRPHFTSFEGLLRVVILMPFLLVGFDIIPQAAEEIRLPRREVGRLILISIGMASVWYSLVQWGVGVSLPLEAHRVSELPTADAAARVLGTPWAGQVLVVGGILGILTSWNGFLVGATRLMLGMGRAGMLPASFARLHDRYGTPSSAITLVTACSVCAPLLGRQALVWVANVGSLATVVAYCLVAVAFVVLRRREPGMLRPYRVRAGAVVGASAVIITFLFVLLYLPPSPSALTWPYEWGIVGGWLVMGGLAFARVRRSAAWIDAASQERELLGEFARGDRPPSEGRVPSIPHGGVGP